SISRKGAERSLRVEKRRKPTTGHKESSMPGQPIEMLTRALQNTDDDLPTTEPKASLDFGRPAIAPVSVMPYSARAFLRETIGSNAAGRLRAWRKRIRFCKVRALPLPKRALLFHPAHAAFMTNRRILRGLFLIAIALFFGIQALAYPLGRFSRAGPGMFPLLVSCILGLIGVFMLVRSRFEQAEPMTFNYRNISIV